MSQGWSVNAATDQITFLIAPPTGTNNIVVNEYASADLNATPLWAIGAWNPSFGYPSEAEFFAERLIFAATYSQPQTMWFSRIGDYSFHGKSTPIKDDDAITYTMNARQLNTIQELVPLESLIALTSGGEWGPDPTGPAPAHTLVRRGRRPGRTPRRPWPACRTAGRERGCRRIGR